MMNILIFYYDFEILSNSTKSIPRLIAQTIHSLEKKFTVSYFTFINPYNDDSLSTKPVYLNFDFITVLQQTIGNYFSKKKRNRSILKKNAILKFIQREKQVYNVIIVPGLNDVHFLRIQFPTAIIIYWIHGISAIYKPQYLKHINDADVIWSPTVTIYRKIIEELHPKVYTGQFQWMPNWAHETFDVFSKELIDQLRINHAITATAKVFIFCGGEKKLKGWYLLESAFRLMKTDLEMVVLFAGGTSKADEKINDQIRVIHTGMLTPQRLSAYYRLAEFGLFPSLGGYEHAPLTLIEMIKCKVIPIASNVGGIEEMLGADYPFLIAAPHAVKEWVHYIEQLLKYNNTDKDGLLLFLNERMQQYAPVNPVSLLKEILPV